MIAPKVPHDSLDFSDDFRDLFNESPMNVLGDLLHYTPHGGGAPRPFKAVFSSSYRGLSMGLIVDIEAHNFECHQNVIPTVTRKSLIHYKGQEYFVTDLVEDGSGWVRYILREV